MRVFRNLAAMARHCDMIALRSQFEMNAGVAAMAKNLYAHAYRIIGDDTKLIPLAESTIAEKQRKGYPAPEEPLVASGQMQSDLEWGSAGPIAGVGNANERQLWHHIGSARYPPRPVLNIAVNESRAENMLLFREFAARALGLGGRIPRVINVAAIMSRVRVGKPRIGADIRPGG